MSPDSSADRQPPQPDRTVREPVLMAWSGGKDSALALQAVLRDASLDVVGLLTTVTEQYERISMHGVRVALLQAQAESIGLPLEQVRIPVRSSNADYEAAMCRALAPWRARGVERVVFGDLFLQDLREYRERLLAKVGMRGLYPLWGLDTHALAREFIEAGFRAVLVCVDPAQLDQGFCGRELDATLLTELPPAADPCGERGEFHTFVYAGPIFRQPLAVRRGDVVSRDGFTFCDLT